MDLWGQHLPLDPILNILSFLDYKTLCSCSQVNRYWCSVSDRNELWKRLCKVDWLATEVQQQIAFKTVYAKYHKSYNKYRSCYITVVQTWKRIEQWLKNNGATNIMESLDDGVTEDQLDKFESESGLKLDLETRCSFRLHNGQRLFARSPGLFGGYKFYDYHVDLQLSSLEVMLQFKTRLAASKNAPEWVKNCLPVAQNINGWKHWFISFNENSTHYRSIIEPTQNFNGVFKIANSYLAMLQNFANDLETGNFEYSEKKKEIIRYPNHNAPTCTTNGVKITCNPLFVPERTVLYPQANYFFAYRIKISMDSTCTARDSCKLTTRHWYITNGHGKLEEVQGPGVIGKYPDVYPGSKFEYASCCPLPTPSGSMRGSFEFQLTSNGELFDAVVPQFEFISPPVISVNEL